jgi:hypothetical protein
VHVIAKQGDKVLADLLIGTYLSGNTMVREKGAVNVATAKGSIKYPFDKEVKEWRDRSIVDVPVDQVQAIAFNNKNGTWKFVKADGAWKQAPGEKAIENFDPSKISSIVSNAAGMRANDFAAADVTADAAGVGATPDGTVTLTTGGADAGVKEILVRVGHKKDTNYYAQREGKDPIYLIAEYAGDRFLPSGPDKFVKEKGASGSPSNPIQVTPEAVRRMPAPGLAEAQKAHGH